MGSERVQRKSKPCDRCAEGRSEAASPAPKGSSPFAAAGPPLGLSVQRKVVVGAPDDPFERQADAAAEKVTRGEAVPEVQAMAAGAVQRASDELVQASSDELVQASSDELVQASSSDELVQAEAAPTGGGGASSDGGSAAAAAAISSRGAGSPLLGSTRSRLESSFGVDLGGVRVHEGPSASTSARALGARAFTHQNHIWLGRGERQTDVSLMAHETTHVLQQDGIVRRQCEPGGGLTALIAQWQSEVRGEAEAPPWAPAEAAEAPAAAAAAPEAAPEAALAEEAAEAPAPDREAPSATAGLVVSELPAPGAAGGDPREPLMPPAPEGVTPATAARMGGVSGRAASSARSQADLPSAGETTGSARGAVTEPEAETAGRAEGALAAELDARPQPSPEIEELCARIRQVICSKRPPDEDALVEASPEEMAREAGGELNQAVEGDAERVSGNYEAIDAPREGAPALTPEGIRDPAARAETSALEAAGAAPDAVPAENVSLDADVAASQARREEAGLESDPARVVAEQGTDRSNPINQAAEGQSELSETAARDPAEVIAEQTAAIARASEDMAALELRAAESLAAAREATVTSNRGRQDGMVESEEETRDRVSREARSIFETTRTQVLAMIEPLPERAMARWTAGVAVLSRQFRADLERVADWIAERHSGVGGFFVGLGDAVFGLPAWVTREYDRAELAFGDGVCDLIREISAQVNGVILAAEQLIESANQRIAALFTDLGPELATWAAEQQAAFSEQLSGLTNQVHQTRDDFNRDLRERASQAVDEVRAEIHALRQAARGLLGRIADAIGAFLDDPAKFIIEGLLKILGISPPAFWAVVRKIGQVIDEIADDPAKFANNLMAALAQGFRQFFDRIGTHLLNGLMRWLFRGLGSVGVTIPSEISTRSVVTFFLQLLGISWPRIRQILARHVGEGNIALLEQAWSLVSTLMERGPDGIFEMIREQLDPQAIFDAILDAAIQYLTQALITRVTARILMMFNPAGAILQAIEAIYRVLKWIFENAARIFSLVETVVNGIADILAGNIGGMANAVETALAGLIPPVIDFLAGYLGLGGLPDAVANAVRGLQGWVERMLDRAIGWLVQRGRALLARLGLARQEGPAEARVERNFSMAGAGHRLILEIRGDAVHTTMASVPRDLLDKVRDEMASRQAAARVTTGDEQERHRNAHSALGRLVHWYEGARTRILAGPHAERTVKLALLADQLVPRVVEVGNQHGLKDFLRRTFDVEGHLNAIERQIVDQLEKHLGSSTAIGDGHANTATAAEIALGWVHSTGQRHIEKTQTAFTVISRHLTDLDQLREHGLDLSGEPMVQRGRAAARDCEQALSDPSAYLRRKNQVAPFCLDLVARGLARPGTLCYSYRP